LIEHSEEALVREARAFLDAISTGRPSRSDGPFGAAVVAVIEPIAASLEAASHVVAEPIR
jgi:hypothetical protein